ncbi:hypothetical protein BJ973_004865 [Actinoplanes tereljensis]|uniref:Uncharacterized protein n=1 Tax=Paractinoplanes tereljensis TaxID=571912 RepID=A0A919NP52_9ACTN|nr:hypothetical protein [Actinoplanes tereljensis]GIF21690.1 hypothetical protein Ate02nite_44200 [Actinoplanes tereljensis]
MIRKTGVALAITAGVLGVAAISAPAFAASGNGVIETGEFVLWKNSSYGAQLRDEYSAVSNYNDGRYFVNSTTKLNDNASSIANYDNSLGVRTYTDSGYSGSYISVLAYGQASGSISWAYSSLGGFNDELSSHKFV